MLLTTKLFAPRRNGQLVARPRLLAKLNAGLTSRVILVSAPAGFGKTTLISAWINALDGVQSERNSGADNKNHPLMIQNHWPQAEDHAPIKFCWLSLDENDNDPLRFLTNCLAALQQMDASVGAAVEVLLSAPQPPPLEALLTLLINDISSITTPFVLVLDDYHVITGQPIHDLLTFWIENLPPVMRLVLTSRSDPALPLARWRVRRTLLEVRASDLRFTQEEASEFLRQETGVAFSSADVATLETRTEGWVAGLQLAALSMQGRHDLAGFIEHFTGSHSYIIDYLAEEVLQRQPETVQTFLLQTSILQRLCGALCDAVTGRNDGQAEV